MCARNDVTAGYMSLGMDITFNYLLLLGYGRVCGKHQFPCFIGRKRKTAYILLFSVGSSLGGCDHVRSFKFHASDMAHELLSARIAVCVKHRQVDAVVGAAQVVFAACSECHKWCADERNCCRDDR